MNLDPECCGPCDLNYIRKTIDKTPCLQATSYKHICRVLLQSFYWISFLISLLELYHVELNVMIL